MDRLVSWLTAARALWVASLITIGAIGTGIGFLLGEGAARASFAAQFQDHEKRLVTVEAHVRASNESTSLILQGLAELKGEVRALRREVRP
jgi:hypothetical protein